MLSFLQTARLTTDVSQLTKEEKETEVHLERQHKVALYKQVSTLKAELSDRRSKVEQLEHSEQKLKSKLARLSAENKALKKR